MKTILEVLGELKRDDVTEVAMVSGRFPCAKVHGTFVPVDDAAPSTRVILRWLEAIGGRAHVDSLGLEPSEWHTEVEGVGRITVLAVRKGDVVQVRALRTRGKKHSLPPSRKSSRPGVHAVPAPEPMVIERTRRTSTRPTRPSTRPSAGTRASRIPPAPRLFELETFEATAIAPRIEITEEPPSLDMLLTRARSKKASDLHVVAGRPPLLRIAGELAPDGVPLDAAAVESMLRAIVPERLVEVLDRDGSADFALDLPERGRFRVNVSRQRTGMKGAFRLIPKEIPTLASLGLPSEIGAALKHHQGLIVITGPTGHGKTTTLAAIVGMINETTTHHVITVEDPVEYVHPRRRAMISQREVGTHTKSFASALKASLREDPDVIVVGELRDTETVRMALSAGETGHLVLGTMNTPSAAKTIDRLIDLFPPADQQQVRTTLAGALRLIVSQRLLPNTTGNKMVAAAEVLPGSIPLWNLIRDNKTYQIPSLQQRGRALGIVRLDDSLSEVVRSGHVAAEVARHYAEDPKVGATFGKKE